MNQEHSKVIDPIINYLYFQKNKKLPSTQKLPYDIIYNQIFLYIFKRGKMPTKFRLFSIREQIFLIYMGFFSSISLVSSVFNIANSLQSNILVWIIIGVISIIFIFLGYKRQKSDLIHIIGAYFTLFIILPLLWIPSRQLSSPNVAYTILIFIFINYITTGKKRIILNISGILLMQMIFMFIYKKLGSELYIDPKLHFTHWMLIMPFIVIFISILLITIERTYKIERLSLLEKEELIKTLSVTDKLTGLYNKKYMEKKLKFIHSTWKRGVKEYSIIMLDIDFFIEYLDRYGKRQGLTCLKTIGKIIQGQLSRDADYAFRYEKEKFLILLGFTDSDGAKLIAEKVQLAIKNAHIPNQSSKISPDITLSIGVATINDTSSSFSHLFNRATKALEKAKQFGMNAIVRNND